MQKKILQLLCLIVPMYIYGLDYSKSYLELAVLPHEIEEDNRQAAAFEQSLAEREAYRSKLYDKVTSVQNKTQEKPLNDYDKLVYFSKYYGLTIDFNNKNNDLEPQSYICTLQNSDDIKFRKLKVNKPKIFDDREMYLTQKKMYFLHHKWTSMSDSKFLAKTTDGDPIYRGFMYEMAYFKEPYLYIYKDSDFYNEDYNFKLIKYSCKKPTGFKKVKMLTKLKIYQANEAVEENF